MKALWLSLCFLISVNAEGLAHLYALETFPKLEYQQELSEEDGFAFVTDTEEEEAVEEKPENEVKKVEWEDPLWHNPDRILGAGTNQSWDELIALERHVQDYRTTVFASVTASNIYSAYSTGVAYQEFTSSKFNWGISIEREKFYWKNNDNPHYPKGQEEVYYNQVWMNWFPAENLQLSLGFSGYVRD